MPFCPKCGAEYQDGTKFCGTCGQTVNNAESAPTAVAPIAATPASGSAYPSFFEKILNTKDYTAQMNADDIKQNKVMAILAFCGMFAYILFNWFNMAFLGLLAFAGLMVAPCLAYKKSEYVKFQLAQIYVAFFGVLIFGVLDTQISGFFYNLIAPNLNDLNNLSGWLGVADGSFTVRQVFAHIVAWVIHLVFMAVPTFVLVIGFIDVIKERAKAMPFIGKIKVTFEK